MSRVWVELYLSTGAGMVLIKRQYYFWGWAIRGVWKWWGPDQIAGSLYKNGNHRSVQRDIQFRPPQEKKETKTKRPACQSGKSKGAYCGSLPRGRAAMISSLIQLAPPHLRITYIIHPMITTDYHQSPFPYICRESLIYALKNTIHLTLFRFHVNTSTSELVAFGMVPPRSTKMSNMV